jgi:hypothetical protein
VADLLAALPVAGAVAVAVLIAGAVAGAVAVAVAVAGAGAIVAGVPDHVEHVGRCLQARRRLQPCR